MNGIDGVPGTKGDPGDPGGPGDPGRSPAYTGPGLALELSAPTVSGSTASVEIVIADGDGVPLDREGLFTEGEVSISLVVAYLELDANGDPAGYIAYTTRTQTSPITNVTEVQASSDQGGTFEELEPGRYRYTFAAAVVVPDPALTHTIAAYATRTFEDVRYVANHEVHFRPDGQAPEPREVVVIEACGQCHDDLSAHGGARRDLILCQTCHSRQTVDPDTGNTVDLKVMIHKIHRGASLPSVVAGGTYQIIGFRQTVFDFSKIHFPREIENCETCHTGPDGERWRTAPGRAACLACHDDTSFVDPPPAGFRLHGGGAQPDGAPCHVCHAPSGSIAGITDVHMTPLRDPANPDVAVEILSIRNTAPGQIPEVDVRVTVDGAGRDIVASPLSTMRMTVAGPNTDYASYFQVTAQGTGASGTLVPIDATAGEFTYVFPPSRAITPEMTGSYTLGIEASISIPNLPRFGALSPVMAFATTDSSTIARRAVVSNDACNACHFDLAFHGGGRKNVEYCVLCHNPNNPNEERASRREDAVDQMIHATDAKRMIHKIHAGSRLSEPYVLGANPSPTEADPDGTPADLRELVHYPSTLSNCTVCHLDGTHRLPIASGASPSLEERRTCREDPALDADEYCDSPFWVRTSTIYVAPETAVCTSCHDQPSVMVHAEIMTAPGGRESCAVCHGPGSGYDVDVVHGL